MVIWVTNCQRPRAATFPQSLKFHNCARNLISISAWKSPQKQHLKPHKHKGLGFSAARIWRIKPDQLSIWNDSISNWFQIMFLQIQAHHAPKERWQVIWLLDAKYNCCINMCWHFFDSVLLYYFMHRLKPYVFILYCIHVTQTAVQNSSLISLGL